MFLRTERFTITSPCNPTEIVTRLSSDICSDEIWIVFVAPFSDKQFIGQVTPSFIRLRVRNRIKNIFQPVLTATIEPIPSGSELHCRVGLMPLSIAMLSITAVLFFPLLCCLITSALSAVLAEPSDWSSLWPALFFILLLLSFVIHGWHLARGEREQLKIFLFKELAVS
jgi:hypothetical protein